MSTESGASGWVCPTCGWWTTQGLQHLCPFRPPLQPAEVRQNGYLALLSEKEAAERERDETIVKYTEQTEEAERRWKRAIMQIEALRSEKREAEAVLARAMDALENARPFIDSSPRRDSFNALKEHDKVVVALRAWKETP